MAFTDAEIRELSAANEQHGWAPVPQDCPPRFRAQILEKRARQIGLRAAAPAPVTPAEPQADVDRLRDRLNTISIL